jgi:ribosomal protein S18 acetylase RimI-like enzyme
MKIKVIAVNNSELLNEFIKIATSNDFNKEITKNTKKEIKELYKQKVPILFILNINAMNVGTYSLSKHNNNFALSYINIHPQYKNLGFGKILIKKVINITKRINKNSFIFLACRIELKEFYNKFNFKKIKDEGSFIIMRRSL